VLEIGCGSSWSAARRAVRHRLYLASDVDVGGVGEPPVPGTAIMGADGRFLPLRSASLDTVIVSNVFGDPGLGETVATAIGVDGLRPEDYRRYLVEEVLPSGVDEARRVGMLILETRLRVVATKDALLRELGRVLRSGGGAFVIETLTPLVAGKYFRDCTMPSPVRGPLELVEVHSSARRRQWCTDAELAAPALETWLIRAP
jgi:hypothetical protein